MAIVTVVCLMIWTGMLPTPDPGFSEKEKPTAEAQPCPPADAVTTEIVSIPVNVYNGTDSAGLASTVADVLTDAGMTVGATTDWPRGTYDGDVLITSSQAGLTNAYTLSRAFSGTVTVRIDENTDAADTTVSIVLGSEYEHTILTAGEIGQLVLQIRDPTTLAQIERGRGARGATAGPDRYQQKSTGNGETPPGQGRESAHHDETEQDSQESAGDGGAMGGGDATTLPRLAMGLTRTDQLALGAQRSHVPHCGPVHGLDLRSTSKDLRAPAADAGLIGGEGVARGQDPQLGGVAVLGVGQAHHLSTSNQERQKVHGENRHERHQHPDLDSHSSTVCGSGPPR